MCTATEAQTDPKSDGRYVTWTDMRNRDTTGNDVYVYDLVTSTETAVCTQSGDQMDPQLSGTWVVWMDARNYETSNWDIYGYDLATGTERAICTAPGFQGSPRISGDWVVWEDEANTSASGQDIYAYSLATGETLPVCTAPSNQLGPHVSGNWVVWLDERNWNASRWDLYAKNLVTGEEHAVCTAPENQWNLDVSGDWVVWTDRRSESTSGYDIYARNLVSGGERAICTAPRDQERPRIEGDVVVWTDGRNYPTSGYDVYAYDLTGAAERPLCTTVGDQQSPEISGNWVTWNDGRNADQSAGDYSDIYALDLANGTERTVCTAPRNQWMPVISGNWIVWHDGRSGTDPMTENSADWDVYGYDLSAEINADCSLDGKITDRLGNPLLGCTISALDSTSKDVVGTTASLAGGYYALSLPAGTYDIIASPPGNAGVQAATYLVLDLRADRMLDFVLAPSGVATLSGHVSDAAGQPLAGWAVYVFRASGGQQWVQTDASGAYSIALAPGDITGVAFTGGDDVYIDSVPGQDPLSVQGDTTLDFTLPMHNVNVVVKDAAGEPVSGATVRVGTTEQTGPFTMGGLSFNGSSAWSRRTTTDAGGSLTAQLLASAAPYTFTITPPVGDTRFAVTTVSGVMVAGEKTLTLTLLEPVTLSGHVSDAAGQPLVGWDVYLHRTVGGYQFVRTDDAGLYSIALAPGEIAAISLGAGDDVYIDSVPGQDPLSVQGDTTLDFTLPMHNVNVVVKDAAGEPVSGATVRVGTTEQTGPFTMGGLSFNGSSAWSRRTTTDAGGSLTAQLLASAAPYTFTITPPVGDTRFAVTTVSGVMVAGEKTLTLTLLEPVTLSGHVSDAAGQPLVGWDVYLHRTVGGYQFVRTDDAGLYSIALAPGEIAAISLGAGDDVYIDSVPGQDPLSVQGDTTLDFTLPMHNVNVVVKDAAGEPVSGATVRVGTTEQTGPFTMGGLSFNGSSAWSRRTTTDAGGSLTAQLLASAAPYTFTITPPVGDTRFAVTTVSGVMVAGEKTLVVALQSTDSTPPTTTASPNDDAWRPGPLEVHFTAMDVGSGVAYTEYSLDNGSTWHRASSVLIAAEGATTVLYRSADVAGNREAAKTVVVHVANTIAGSNQTVELPSKVALTFDTVTASGLTTVVESAADPGPEPAPFQVAEQSFFQIETTAVVEGPITVALPYDATGLTLEQQQALQLMHLDGGAWIDVTTWVDTTAHLVYGSVAHFSWFALAVDTAAPTISITSPAEGAQYVKGQVVQADWSAADEETGIDPLATYSSPVGSGAALDTSTLGAKTLVVTATDKAGNVATKTVHYSVAYASAGVAQPVNGDGTSVFKLSSTVPLKFAVTDVAGQPATGLAPRLYLSKLSSGIWGSELEPLSTNQPDAGNLFRETASGTYMFNLKAKGLSTGTWRVRINLGNGGLIYAQFSVK